MQHQFSDRSSFVASGSNGPAQQSYRSHGGHYGRTSRGPSTSNNRKAHSVSPQTACFASSQFCSSPSARAIPMPPMHWIQKKSNEPHPRPVSSTSSESSTTSNMSSSPSSPTSSGKSSPAYENDIVGIRVCPLKLIAAVASA